MIGRSLPLFGRLGTARDRREWTYECSNCPTVVEEWIEDCPECGQLVVRVVEPAR